MEERRDEEEEKEEETNQPRIKRINIKNKTEIDLPMVGTLPPWSGGEPRQRLAQATSE